MKTLLLLSVFCASSVFSAHAAGVNSQNGNQSIAQRQFDPIPPDPDDPHCPLNAPEPINSSDAPHPL